MTFPFSPDIPGSHKLAGAPQGHDARLLADLARQCEAQGQPLLHIALDDSDAARLADNIRFFAPDLVIHEFPAWDCLPYDRVSPNGEIISRRVVTLSRLASNQNLGGALILSTLNAVTQKVPSAEVFAKTAFLTHKGAKLKLEQLQDFLVANGYTRTETVREPGEFALRGGIVDLFPPGDSDPVRIDLFGDQIESLRRFDAMSQRSIGQIDSLELFPVSEVFLDENSISRFRKGYREAFGAILSDDPLYTAIGEGRRYAGMEHWLPLFHERMVSLFDYVPGAMVSQSRYSGRRCAEGSVGTGSGFL